MSNPFPQPLDFPLALYRSRFRLSFTDACQFPCYPGSAIRGLIGHGLRALLCVTGQKSCEGCQLRKRCGYSRFFDSPGQVQWEGRQVSAAPHPWVLDCDSPPAESRRTLRSYDFCLTLIDDDGTALFWLFHALRKAGRLGLGRQKASFRVDGVWLETALGSQQWLEWEDKNHAKLQGKTKQTVDLRDCNQLDFNKKLRIDFQTPVRIKRHGRLVGPREFSARLVLQALQWRFRDLLALYGLPGGGVKLPDIPEHVDKFLVQADLDWLDWTRYSSRQGTRMKLGGVVGSCQLDVADQPEWWPLLWLGQWLHIGKQTSFGLGKYRLETLA